MEIRQYLIMGPASPNRRGSRGQQGGYRAPEGLLAPYKSSPQSHSRCVVRGRTVPNVAVLDHDRC